MASFIITCLLITSLLPNSLHSINPIEIYQKLYEQFYNESLELAKNTTFTMLKLKSASTTQLTSKPPLLQGGNNDKVPISRIPPSFTILMNFQNDGTTNLQMWSNAGSWTDTVSCKHGQVYDPTIMICREVFCTTGYILSSQGCIPDNNSNTSYSEPIRKPPGEMQVELTMRHSLCIFDPNNQTTEAVQLTAEGCRKKALLEESDELLEVLHTCLSEALHTNKSRIAELELLEHKFKNETIFHNLTSFNPNATELFKEEFVELLRFQFVIKDRNDFPNETKETVALFYQLNLLMIAGRTFTISEPNEEAKLTNVTDTTNIDPSAGWCTSPGDSKAFIRDDFTILASFDQDDANPEYYVYVNDTDTLYGTGYYVLSLLFTTEKFGGIDMNSQGLNYSKASGGHGDVITEWRFNIHSDTIYSNNNRSNYDSTGTIVLTDVTRLVLEQNSNKPTGEILSVKVLTVCNIAPKIRVDCSDHNTVRVNLCELKKMPDRSFCSHLLDKCYFINEYEYDPDEPEDFIRVCKSGSSNSTHHAGTSKTTNYSFSMYRTSLIVTGWASMILGFLSILFMVLTLITYLFLDELRNLPGWNMINLTAALFIAQFSFFIGSFLNHLELFCFFLAIMTHYGFLASFFWMNVIAYDLHRNFSQRRRHILLREQSIKSRVTRYAAYAWLVPLLIVLIAIVIDLSFTESNQKIRPCYSGYLSGCKADNAELSRSAWLANNPHFNQTKLKYMMISGNYTHKTCYNVNSMYDNVLILRSTCWIQNGFSNLIFFGLPIGLIIIVNAVFYVLTILNVHGYKSKQKKDNNQLRRFSKVKLPVDREFKFYIQMGVIMGFTWIIGFFLIMFSKTSTGEESDSLQLRDIIFLIFTCLFILFNSSAGMFIFFAFIFRRRVLIIFLRKWSTLQGRHGDEATVDNLNIKKGQARSREVSQSSTATFLDSLRRTISTESSASATEPSVSPVAEMPSPSISMISSSHMAFNANSDLSGNLAKSRVVEQVTSSLDDDENVYI